MTRALLVVTLLVASQAHAQPVVTKANVPENSPRTWPVDFRDTGGALAVPAGAEWYMVTFANNVLVPITGIVPAAHVDISAPGLTIPPAELSPANPNLPEQIPVAMVVRSTNGANITVERTFWFSLQNNAQPPPP